MFQDPYRLHQRGDYTNVLLEVAATPWPVRGAQTLIKDPEKSGPSGPRQSQDAAQRWAKLAARFFRHFWQETCQLEADARLLALPTPELHQDDLYPSERHPDLSVRPAGLEPPSASDGNEAEGDSFTESPTTFQVSSLKSFPIKTNAILPKSFPFLWSRHHGWRPAPMADLVSHLHAVWYRCRPPDEWLNALGQLGRPPESGSLSLRGGWQLWRPPERGRPPDCLRPSWHRVRPPETFPVCPPRPA